MPQTYLLELLWPVATPFPVQEPPGRCLSPQLELSCRLRCRWRPILPSDANASLRLVIWKGGSKHNPATLFARINAYLSLSWRSRLMTEEDLGKFDGEGNNAKRSSAFPSSELLADRGEDESVICRNQRNYLLNSVFRLGVPTHIWLAAASRLGRITPLIFRRRTAVLDRAGTLLYCHCVSVRFSLQIVAFHWIRSGLVHVSLKRPP